MPICEICNKNDPQGQLTKKVAQYNNLQRNCVEGQFAKKRCLKPPFAKFAKYTHDINFQKRFSKKMNVEIGLFAAYLA